MAASGNGTRLEIIVAGMRFIARLETERAPRTCARFLPMLPLKTKLVQARWSGEAGLRPVGDLQLALGFENHPSRPAPRQPVPYPRFISGTAILVSEGVTPFGSQ